MKREEAIAPVASGGAAHQETPFDVELTKVGLRAVAR